MRPRERLHAVAIRPPALGLLFLALIPALASCATSARSDHERGDVLLPGASIEEAATAAALVLEQAGFTVEQRMPDEISATTGDGLAPDEYGDLILCGEGHQDAAAGLYVRGPGVDRPTGHFEVRVAPYQGGARLWVTTDFTARACRTEDQRRTCEAVVCESTGVLEQRIRDRAAGA